MMVGEVDGWVDQRRGEMGFVEARGL